MTPKEKAEDLIREMKLGWLHSCTHYMARICATKCVDEVLKVVADYKTFEYWQEVKQEINKL